MATREQIKQTLERMKHIRSEILREYPFYGELALGLSMGVADVKTAMTDMKHIVFDPAFAARLTDLEMMFVYMHELLHCVLFHCVRGADRQQRRWNVACDIVVNSNILLSLGKNEMTVDGVPVIHTISLPDVVTAEGYSYTAEEVYEMLPQDDSKLLEGESIDNHEYWDEVTLLDAERDRLTDQLLEAAGKWADTNEILPKEVIQEYDSYRYKKQIKWRDVCRDFIRQRVCEYDYNFRPPDRRFMDEDFLYPGFNPVEGDVVENILFCVDKSGSISIQIIRMIMQEIGYALKDVKGLSGLIAYFDLAMTQPKPFSNEKELIGDGILRPGGGTDFHCIFQYVHKKMKKKPTAIIILTDGQADFPSGAEIKGIPTLWIIIDGKDRVPKSGKSVHIDSSLSL